MIEAAVAPAAAKRHGPKKACVAQAPILRGARALRCGHCTLVRMNAGARKR
jgi:hypothetical protein